MEYCKTEDITVIGRKVLLSDWIGSFHCELGSSGAALLKGRAWDLGRDEDFPLQQAHILSELSLLSVSSPYNE